MATKKKESLWELITRLDEEAAEFNTALTHANQYFDKAASRTKSVLDKHERDLHKTIAQLRRALKNFTKQNKKKEP